MSDMDIAEKAFEYLDRLRESGVTNMWLAGPYLASHLGLPNEKATPLHLGWMDSFDPEKTPKERADAMMKARQAQGEGK